MSKPPLIFFIVVAIIAVLATRQFIKQRRETAVNDASPVRSLSVEVKTKREYPAPNRRSRQREEIVAEDMKYEAWFHPLNGASDFKVLVSAGDYHQMDKGVKRRVENAGQPFRELYTGTVARCAHRLGGVEDSRSQSINALIAGDIALPATQQSE